MAKFTAVIVFCGISLILLANSIETTKPYTGCQGEFHGKCTCGVVLYDGQKRYVTNCTNAMFNTMSMLSEMPTETEILIFTGNNISTVPQNVFGKDVLFDKLVEIDFSRNNISKVQGQAFHRIPNVRKLVLNNNNWSVDKEYTRLLANLKSLEELHLDGAFDISYNESITTLLRFFDENPLKDIRILSLSRTNIGPNLVTNIFCGMPTLEVINLSGNGIQRIYWNSTCLSNLHTLDISDNEIPYLTNDVLTELKHFPNLALNISGNPFDCDCHMADFYRWLHDTHDVHLLGKEKFRCQFGYPENNEGRLILDLQEADLQCRIRLAGGGYIGAAHTAVIVSLVGIVTLLSIFIVYLNRKVVMRFVHGFGEPIYRRMQYSTIHKQETEREVDL